MDIDLARTFLEVVRTGSFVAAGEALSVTQTAVTARIRNLESQLGCRLFVRNRGGASVTRNGEHFIPHANQLIHTWEVARRDLPLPEGASQLLTLGGEISLWNPLFLDWVTLLRGMAPELAMRAEIGEPATIHDKLSRDSIDAALIHQPSYWPGMQVEQVLEEKLILVGTPNTEAPYIYVDWGEDFRRQHDAALPQYAHASNNFDLGPLALHYLLKMGGRGYFRTRVVQKYLQEGTLERIPEFPEFTYPIYSVYRRNHENDSMAVALQALHQAVSPAATPDAQAHWKL